MIEVDDIPASALAIGESIARDLPARIGGDNRTFAARVIARAIAERDERCAKVCEEQAAIFLTPEYSYDQPMGSIMERFACETCAAAIRKGAAS